MPRNLQNIRNQLRLLHSQSRHSRADRVYVRHENPEAGDPVSTIQIVAENSGFHVRAEFAHEANYILGTLLLGPVRYYDFEGRVPGISYYSIKLETQNTRLFLFFIKELIRISPGLGGPALLQALGAHGFRLRDALTAQEIPTWDGYLTQRRETGKTFDYRNTSVQAKIRKIKVLHENQCPRFNVHVECSSDENFNSLLSILAAENIIDASYDRLSRECIYFHIDQNQPESIQKFRLFMTKLQAFEPLLVNDDFRRLCAVINMGSITNQRILPINDAVPTQIMQQRPFATALQEAERQSFAEHYGHTSASYLPSQSTCPRMPDIGANAKALEELNIDAPEHLTCPLSLQIMTDPVYFLDLPSGNKQCFESSWILDHLRRDKRHPINRESLIGKKLVVNEALKKECEEFVGANQAPVLGGYLPGMRTGK